MKSNCCQAEILIEPDDQLDDWPPISIEEKALYFFSCVSCEKPCDALEEK